MAKRTRPIKGLERRYVWRLYPTVEQQGDLLRQMAMCAQLWNALLSMCEQRYQRAVQRTRSGGLSFHCHRCAVLSADAGKLAMCEDHRHPSEFAMGYWITAMLAECQEWRALSTWTPRRVATSLAACWQAFFKGGGYPRYKAVARSFQLPHRCRTPGSDRGGSGCLLTKSPRHRNSWTVKMKGVPGEVWARREQPTQFHEWMDADVHFKAGRWTISVAVDAEPYHHGANALRTATTVKFGVVGGLAEVNGEIEAPDKLLHAQLLDDRVSEMRAQFDVSWPRGKRLTDEERSHKAEDALEISRLAARVARVRSEALHEWSKRVVDRSSMLTITMPKIRESTATPRGDEREWGANVESVSSLNRSVLSFAPSLAASMLRYKAEQAGIRCTVVEDESPMVGVGADLVAAGKSTRRVRAKLRKMKNA